MPSTEREIKYRQTEKYKAKQLRYQSKPEAQELHRLRSAKYRKTEAGKMIQFLYLRQTSTRLRNRLRKQQSSGPA